MFNTGAAGVADAEGDQESRGGLFSRMRDSLSKSRRAMTQQLAAVWAADIAQHPEDWHMLQKVFAADLDAARLPAPQ